MTEMEERLAALEARLAAVEAELVALRPKKKKKKESQPMCIGRASGGRLCRSRAVEGKQRCAVHEASAERDQVSDLARALRSVTPKGPR